MLRDLQISTHFTNKEIFRKSPYELRKKRIFLLLQFHALGTIVSVEVQRGTKVKSFRAPFLHFRKLRKVCGVMGKLEGKVAVITGASKGIGEGIAKVYAKYGAKCVLEGYEATGVQVDVSDYKSVERIVEVAEKTYGKIDVLVCNAGVCVLEDFLEDDTFENRDLHLDINVKGAWNVAKAVIPSMIANGGGAIVVTSSVTGDMVADPGEVAYATSKAALVGFTKALAREFADKNIRVNAICPGYVRTPLVEGMAKQSDPENPERAIQAIADAVPLKRLADPEEVGELAAFLGCYESSYITGTQIVIDGGSTLPETTSMGQ